MAVADLLPPPIREPLADLAAVVDGELAEVRGRAPLGDLRGRLLAGTPSSDAVGQLAGAALDALADELDVLLYDRDLSDDTRRQLVLDAFEFHRRRGTRGSLEAALVALGAGAADVVEPAEQRAVSEVYYEYEAATGRAWLHRWNEFLVVLTIDEAFEEASGSRPVLSAVERAVRVTAPAHTRPVLQIVYAEPGDLPADQWEQDGALYEARRVLGRGYDVRQFGPSLGGRPLDGSWSLAPDSVVARPLAPGQARPAELAPGGFSVVGADPADDATEVELQPWGSAGYVEDSYTLTFGGVDYEIPTATLTGYRAVADSVPSPAVVPAPSASPAPLGRVLLLRPSDPPA